LYIHSVLVLTAQRLRELVPAATAVAAVREAFLKICEGDFDLPQRVSGSEGRALAMLACERSGKGTVAKVVTVTPGNASKGLPTIHALVLWFDGPTGRPVALMDGNALTAIRTGAASGVATDLFARPQAAVLCVIGAGAQAADQVEAVCAVRSITDVRIVSRGGVSSRLLAKRLTHAHPDRDIHAVESIAEAVADADVICCVTSSTSPLFALAQLRPDVHINAVGAYTPAMCEIGADVLEAARPLVVDLVGPCLAEAGDVIQALAMGAIRERDLQELGSALAETRRDSGGISVFKSVGVAAQDWAVAKLAYEASLESGPLPTVDLMLN
jgi:ornithine cyclodeaminase/alanine dehydrogenase-like protein (mu-crystallin family)